MLLRYRKQATRRVQLCIPYTNLQKNSQRPIPDLLESVLDSQLIHLLGQILRQ